MQLSHPSRYVHWRAFQDQNKIIYKVAKHKTLCFFFQCRSTALTDIICNEINVLQHTEILKYVPGTDTVSFSVPIQMVENYLSVCTLEQEMSKKNRNPGSNMKNGLLILTTVSQIYVVPQVSVARGNPRHPLKNLNKMYKEGTSC